MNELFKIYKVDHFEAEKIDQSPNNPHQHDFEELIIGIKGQLMHFIDFETQTINAPFISFVSKGKIHRASPKKVEGECDFWVIRFKTEFIPEITFQLYNYYHAQANFRLTTSYAIQRLDTLCRLIYEEYARQNSELAIIKDLLTALLTVIESERKKVSTTTVNLTNNQNTTFKNFLTKFLLEISKGKISTYIRLKLPTEIYFVRISINFFLSERISIYYFMLF